MNKNVIKAAQILWDYHLINDRPEESDLIMVLGSHDLRVADRGVDLFFKGLSKQILFSGGLGNLTLGVFDKPEAELFAELAMTRGVPKDSILIENKSTNTGDNIKFSYELLLAKNLLPKSIILVQKPYMQKRTYATFTKQWPGNKIKVSVTAPQIAFLDYPTKEISMDTVTNIMVGDLQRIIEYPKKGFQTHMEVPENVIEAYKYLVHQGYTNHLIKD